MLKPEEINGKMYQPVKCSKPQTYHCVRDCVINFASEVCHSAPCTHKERSNGLPVYYMDASRGNEKVYEDNWGLYSKGEAIGVNGKRVGFIKTRLNIEGE